MLERNNVKYNDLYRNGIAYNKAYRNGVLVWGKDGTPPGYAEYVLTEDKISGELGESSQRYIGGEKVVYIPAEWQYDLDSLFRDNSSVEKVIMPENDYVTSMYSMFRSSKATTLDLSSFDVSKVKTVARMFRSSNATVVDVSSFDTSKVKTFETMFLESKVETLYVRNQEEADRYISKGSLPSSVNIIIGKAPAGTFD